MAEALILDSFVTAIACLCAANYGPNTNPDSLKYNIADSISTWDQDVLQIFVESNHKFNFAENCMLTDRFNDVENGECNLPMLLAQITGFREKLKQMGKSHDIKIEQKDKIIAELEKENSILRAKANGIQAQTPPTPPPPPLESNSCVDKKHGVNKLKVHYEEYVFCDNDVSSQHGEGWMLFARRLNGREHFYRNWTQYIDGFGKFGENAAFFSGLELLHALTVSKPHKLLIILTDKENITRYAHYDRFLIGNENERFALQQLGNYVGDAGDSLTYHVGQQFSTYDVDNDSNPDVNCAYKHTGAWWYKDCLKSNLFGLYRTMRSKTDPHVLNGMIWQTFHNTDDGSLNTMKMYIRPREKSLIFYGRH